jgi:protein-disulfide isomerase
MSMGAMSSRAQEKERARQARLDAERAAAARTTRKRRLATLGGVLAAAVVVLAVAIAASQAGTDDEAPTAGEARALLAGIPQDGPWLGRPDAPVVVEEFADLQCPFCAQAARDTLPALVRDYVRTGQVRIRFRTLTFLGPDSVEAGRAAVAAGERDGLWSFTERFFARQGEENSGYVTPAFLREVAGSAGLPADRVLEGASDPRVERLLAEDDAAMQRSGVTGTPTFLVGPRGGELRRVEGFELDAVRAAIDAQLAREP